MTSNTFKIKITRGCKDEGEAKVKIGKSKIHGYGIMATHVLAHGEVINDESLSDDWRFGGYNHSCDPNVILARTNLSSRGILVIALRHISRREELTVDYSHFGFSFGRNGRLISCKCPAHKKRHK